MLNDVLYPPNLDERRAQTPNLFICLKPKLRGLE
jgi:hypothetical protein